MKKAILIGAVFLSSIFSLKAQSDTNCFSPTEKEKADQYEMVISAYKGADSTSREERMEYILTLFNYHTMLKHKIDLEKAANEDRLQEVQDLEGMRRVLDLEMRLKKVDALLSKEMEIGFTPKQEARNDSVPVVVPKKP